MGRGLRRWPAAAAAAVVAWAFAQPAGGLTCDEARRASPDAFHCVDGDTVTRVASPRECTGGLRRLCSTLRCTPSEECEAAMLRSWPVQERSAYLNSLITRTCQCLSAPGVRLREDALGGVVCETPEGLALPYEDQRYGVPEHTMRLQALTCDDLQCWEPLNVMHGEIRRRLQAMPECADTVTCLSGAVRYTWFMSPADPLTIVDNNGATCTEEQRLGAVETVRSVAWCRQCNPDHALDPWNTSAPGPAYTCAKDAGSTCEVVADAEGCEAAGGVWCVDIADGVNDVRVLREAAAIPRVRSTWDLCVGCFAELADAESGDADGVCCVDQIANATYVAPRTSLCPKGSLPCDDVPCARSSECEEELVASAEFFEAQQKAVAEAACECLGDGFGVIKDPDMEEWACLNLRFTAAWDFQSFDGSTFPYVTCNQLTRCKPAAALKLFEFYESLPPTCGSYRTCLEQKHSTSMRRCAAQATRYDVHGNVCSATQGALFCDAYAHVRACAGCAGGLVPETTACATAQARAPFAGPQDDVQCAYSLERDICLSDAVDAVGGVRREIAALAAASAGGVETTTAFCADIFTPPAYTPEELCDACAAGFDRTTATPGVCCVNPETLTQRVVRTGAACPLYLPGTRRCTQVACAPSAACNATLADPAAPVPPETRADIHRAACKCLGRRFELTDAGVCVHRELRKPFDLAIVTSIDAPWVYAGLSCEQMKLCLGAARLAEALATAAVYAAAECAGMRACVTSNARQVEVLCRDAGVAGDGGVCGAATQAAVCGVTPLALQCSRCAGGADPQAGGCYVPGNDTCRTGTSYEACARADGYFCPDMYMHRNLAPEGGRAVHSPLAREQGDRLTMSTGTMLLLILLSCLCVICVLGMLLLLLRAWAHDIDDELLEAQQRRRGGGFAHHTQQQDDNLYVQY